MLPGRGDTLRINGTGPAGPRRAVLRPHDRQGAPAGARRRGGDRGGLLPLFQGVPALPALEAGDLAAGGGAATRAGSPRRWNVANRRRWRSRSATTAQSTPSGCTAERIGTPGGATAEADRAAARAGGDSPDGSASGGTAPGGRSPGGRASGWGGGAAVRRSHQAGVLQQVPSPAPSGAENQVLPHPPGRLRAAEVRDGQAAGEHRLGRREPADRHPGDVLRVGGANSG